MHTKYFIIGAGGHAKVVLNAAFLSGMVNIAIWDDDVNLLGQSLLGVNIQAPVDMKALLGEGHIAVGCSRVRKKLSKQCKNLGLKLKIIIHPESSVAKTSMIGEGSFVAAQAVLAPNCSLEKCVIVNHGAIIDHDCIVGDFSHIAPNATLGGNVHIGKECLVGSSAVVLPGVIIADGVTIGAGSVVVSSILQPGVTVMGAPAK